MTNQPFAALRLGTAHLTWACLVLLGTVFTVLRCVWLRWPPLEWSTGATLLLVSATVYLIVTAAVHFRLGVALRRDESLKGGKGVLLAAHGVVLVVAIVCLYLGPASRVLLAGFDPLVAVLGVTAVVSPILLGTGVCCSPKPMNSTSGTSRLPAVWWATLGAAAILVAFSTANMERGAPANIASDRGETRLDDKG